MRARRAISALRAALRYNHEIKEGDTSRASDRPRGWTKGAGGRGGAGGEAVEAWAGNAFLIPEEGVGRERDRGRLRQTDTYTRGAEGAMGADRRILGCCLALRARYYKCVCVCVSERERERERERASERERVCVYLSVCVCE
jgi:hypothetical protein